MGYAITLNEKVEFVGIRRGSMIEGAVKVGLLMHGIYDPYSSGGE